MTLMKDEKGYQLRPGISLLSCEAFQFGGSNIVIGRTGGNDSNCYIDNPLKTRRNEVDFWQPDGQIF